MVPSTQSCIVVAGKQDLGGPPCMARQLLHQFPDRPYGWAWLGPGKPSQWPQKSGLAGKVEPPLSEHRIEDETDPSATD
jgi:hypothetical protein